MEILKRLRMMDYKDMATPMALNLNLLSDVSCHDVLSYFLSIDVPDISETCSLGCIACSEVPEGCN